MAKTTTQSEDEMGFSPNRYDDGSDPGAGSQLARQQKLEKQKALMDQKKRQRQMQNGMVMASNLGSRPISSKNLRPTSRPQSLTTSSKGVTYNLTGLASPNRRLSSSSSSAPDQHDENISLIPPVLHEFGVKETTSFSNSMRLEPEEEVSPTPAPNLTAAKLMAMGIASSLDYDSSSDKEDGADGELSAAEGMDATMEETGDDLAMVAPRTSGATTAMGEAPLAPSQGHDESSRNAMAQALMEQLKNIKEFVMMPAPEGVTIKCRITREKKPSPLYLLHLEQDIVGSKIFLLAAQKRKRNRSSNYLLSIDQNDFERQSDNVVAKLRSNFVGTSFTIYDSGLNPEDTKVMPDGSNLRQELAAVHYETNVLGFKGPRKMTVILPGVHLNKTRVVIQPKTENETLLSRWKANQTAQLLALYNKQPVWSEETQAYVLNFHGRVTQASVKNFQLIHDSDPNYVIVQFGRVSDEIFTLDYSFPASAVQALAIALSSFDSKLACE